MDYQVIVSPEKGFWSDHGWRNLLHDATQIPNSAQLVMSFKDESVSLIRRKDIQLMTRRTFIAFLLNVCLKRLSNRVELPGFEGFVGTSISYSDKGFKIHNEYLSMPEAEAAAHKLIWARRPSCEELQVWGQRFLHYLVKSGDEDSLYVISTSSPASAEKLKYPISKKDHR